MHRLKFHLLFQSQKIEVSPLGAYSKEFNLKSLRRHPHQVSLKKTLVVTVNKTGTSKVGAISEAQKPQSFKNCKRGTLRAF